MSASRDKDALRLSSRPWSRVKAQVFAEETHCYLCLKAVDFSLPYRTLLGKENPGYRSVDHVVPLVLGGSNDRANCRLAHLGCNKAKQDRPLTRVKAQVGRLTGSRELNPQSRAW